MSTLESPAAPESPPVASTPATATGLRPDQAGTLEVFAQGIAAAAPSVALAAVPGSLYLIAGEGALFSAVIGGIVVLLVAYTIGLQARRTVSVGSLGTYAGNGLGPAAAVAAGWALLIGYLGFAASGLLGAVLYVTHFLEKLGLDAAGGTGWKVLILVLVAIPALLIPYRGLRLSARLQLGIELLSLLAIAVIFVATWIDHGFAFDSSQFSASGSSSNLVVLGAVLAVGSYAGFESSAGLGQETRDAHRTIPRVLLRTVILLLALYLVGTHTEVAGFVGEHAKLGTDSAPLPVVAENAGVDWVTYVVDLGIAFGMVVFVAAMLNAGARSLFTFGHDRALPVAFTRTHRAFHSPYVGIVALGAVAFAIALTFTLIGTGRLLADVYIGTTATYGYLVSYLLVTVATPIWLYRIRALRLPGLAASVIASLAMIYVLFKNVSPTPAYPFDILPYIFLGLLLVGLGRYAWIRVRDPEQAARIGALQELSEEEQARIAGLETAGRTQR
jgi:amino acid transporter